MKNPKRNILLASMLVCVFTGLFSGVQVYLAQLVWPDHSTFLNPETAFMDVARIAGGPSFDTSRFSPEGDVVNDTNLGFLGNARRRFFSGPGLNNWDMALLKDTTIKEGVNLEFRAEFFNAFNHAQFSQPDGNITDPQTVSQDSGRLQGFGTITSANPPHIMQLSLKLLF